MRSSNLATPGSTAKSPEPHSHHDSQKTHGNSGFSPLGNSAKKPTTTARAARFKLKDAARPLQRDRVAKCGHVALNQVGAVGMWVDADGISHTANLHHCASVWTCPTCSAAISVRRAGEVTRGVSWWRAQGGEVQMVTLTVSHGIGDDLETVRRAVSKVWSRVKSGRQWTLFRERYGLQHDIRALETTHGYIHGWHPHLHVLAFTRKLTADERTEMESWLSARWSRFVTEVLGAEHTPDAEHGCTVMPCRNTTYLAKLGLELSSHDTKRPKGGNRTPWQILEDAVVGDARSIRLWKNYSDAMFGAVQLRWSKGLKALCGVTEKPDSELVEVEPMLGADVVVFDVRILRRPGMECRMRELIESQGADALRDWLRTVDVPPPIPYPDEITEAYRRLAA